MKKWIYRGLISGVAFGLAFILAQVATDTTFAQLPTVSCGGCLNLISNGIGLLFNTNSAGSRALFGPVFPMTAPPTSSWTQDNGGTFDTTNGYPYYSVAKHSAAQLSFSYRTAPAAPYTCSALLYWDPSGVSPGTPPTAGNATINGLIVGFRDGSGKIVDLDIRMDNVFSNAGAVAWVTEKWNSSTSSNANYLYQPNNAGGFGVSVSRNPTWLRWGDDNTNLNFYWSIDGQHWKLFDTRSRTDFFAAGPTQVGFGAYANAANVEIAVPSWSCQ